MHLPAGASRDAFAVGLFAYYRAANVRVRTGQKMGIDWLQQVFQTRHLSYWLHTRMALVYMFDVNRLKCKARPGFLNRDPNFIDIVRTACPVPAKAPLPLPMACLTMHIPVRSGRSQ